MADTLAPNPATHHGDPAGFSVGPAGIYRPLSTCCTARTLQQGPEQLLRCFSGRAHDWVVAVLQSNASLFANFEEFLSQFRVVFDHPDQGCSSSQQLLTLRQGKTYIADYAVNLRILAASSGWNEPALIATFWNGLSPVLQTELAYQDEDKDLKGLITLAIALDQHLRGKAHRFPHPHKILKWLLPMVGPDLHSRTAGASSEEPTTGQMQLRYSRLSSDERQQQIL